MLNLWMFAMFCCFVGSTAAHSRFLLHRGEGTVPSENFTYFSLHFPGYLMLVLKTLQGDADLYVSTEISKPTYEPDKYDLHSATCGLDIVYVPKDFKRPLYAGVYGHSAHEKSVYRLEIYCVDGNENLSLTNRIEGGDNVEREKNTETENDKRTKNKMKTVLVKSGLWALVEVFELLFL